MAELTISRFSSLNFDHDWRINAQIPACYVQKFLPVDEIKVQFSIPADGETPIVLLTDKTAGTVTDLTPAQIDSSDEGIFYNVVLTLPAAEYLLQFIIGTNIVAYSYFAVCETLPDSILLQYTHYRNEFGAVFEEQLFYFRVEGIMLPSEVEFAAETEGFNDQQYRLTQLSAFPYESQVLTIGGATGVPNWVARKINYIFSLSDVSIDGMGYVRGEDSNPEITQLHVDYPLYLYKLTIRDNKSPDMAISLAYEYELVLDAGTTEFPANGGSATISAVINKSLNGVIVTQTPVSPTLTGTADGFTLSGATLTASDRTTITGGQRSITISGTAQNDLGDTITGQTTIYQQANQVETYGVWQVSISANPTVIGAAGGTSTITAAAQRNRLYTSNATDTETGTPTIFIESGVGTISGNILTIPGNTDPDERVTVVSADMDGIYANVSVTQSGAGSATVTINNLQVYAYNNTGDSQSVNGNVDFYLDENSLGSVDMLASGIDSGNVYANDISINNEITKLMNESIPFKAVISDFSATSTQLSAHGETDDPSIISVEVPEQDIPSISENAFTGECIGIVTINDAGATSLIVSLNMHD